MQRQETQKIKELASIVAGKTSPYYLYDDVKSVALLKGLEILCDKPNATDGYLFVSMQRRAIEFVKSERKHETADLNAIQNEADSSTFNPIDIIFVEQFLTIIYKATESMTKVQLKFLFYFVVALEEELKNPASCASYACSFSPTRGSAILRRLKDNVIREEVKIEKAGKLRKVQNLRDMRKLLYKRSR